jgi:hypothetical protein
MSEQAPRPRPAKKKAKTADEAPARGTARFQVRLPGFLIEEETGLGEVIKHATSSAGIRPCGGCQKRAAALNRWVSFHR